MGSDILFEEIERALDRYTEEEFSKLDILRSLTNDVDLIDGDGWTALHYAADRGNDQITKILLKSGADVNSTTELGSTPLHFACEKGHTNCIQTILDFKPEINAKDYYRYSYLHYYLKNSQIDEKILKALLDAGADPNSADLVLFKPLHVMARYKSDNTASLAQMLIDYNADVNSQNIHGGTALHYAIYSNNTALVQVLLENGANINILSNDNRTPLDIALELRLESPSTFEVLVEHFAMHYCCGFEVSQDDLDKVREMEIFKNFKVVCDYRLLQLKKENVGQSLATFYDILVSPAWKVAKYLYNSDILNTLQNFDVKDNIMQRRIKQNFVEGLKLHKAVIMGKDSCMRLMILSEQCIEKILEFLSLVDLKNLGEVFDN